MELTENTEPPTNYHRWCAIAILSAALRRKCFLRWGPDTIYPNVYVVLVGPSGRARKGTALNVVRRLLKEAKLPMTADAITPEGLASEIERFRSNAKDGEQHCSVLCMSSELNVFLKTRDDSMHINLTDWYDCPDTWVYKTKNKGEANLTNVYVVLLSATAPEWIPTIFPLQAIGGGLTSRIIFVVEEKKRQSIPIPIQTQREIQLFADLQHDLELIALLDGEFRMTDEAVGFYADWYTRQETKMAQGNYPVQNKLFYGYCDRRATHLRKLGIIISAADSDDRMITHHHISKALDLLELTEAQMPRAFGGVGRAKNAEVIYRAAQIIQDKGEIYRFELMRILGYDVDSETINDIEETLVKMNLMVVEKDLRNAKITYRFIGDKSSKIEKPASAAEFEF